MAREFRFGIGLRTIGSAQRLRDRVRQFADLGYDVVHFPDHLGAPAPLPAMVAAAEAAPGIRVGTYVLNAAFYRPALLARDIGDVNLLCGGRLEAGLGTGYVREEFEAAGIPYPSAGERVEHARGHSDEELMAMPSVLSGSPRRIADTLIAQRDTYGMTYFTVQDYHGKYFAHAINALR